MSLPPSEHGGGDFGRKATAKYRWATGSVVFNLTSCVLKGKTLPSNSNLNIGV